MPAVHLQSMRAHPAGSPPDPSPMDDEQADLIARCKTGEGAAWRRLYMAHFGFVSRSAASLGTPADEVEDVVQEVFAVAVRKITAFSSGRLTTWLYRICANVVTDHHRRRRVRSAFRALFGSSEGEEASPEPLADAQLQQEEARARVQRILERMSPKKREVFALYEIERLSGEEIAERMECPVDTVWSRLFHARKQFRSLALRLELLEPGVRR